MRPVRCESGHAKTEHILGTPTFLAATQALVLSEQGLKVFGAPLLVSDPPSRGCEALVLALALSEQGLKRPARRGCEVLLQAPRVQRSGEC